MWIVWSRKCAVGYFGRRGRSGLTGWATKGKALRNGVGEEVVVKAESESTGARTYVSRQHSSPQIDIRLVSPTAVERPSRKENGKGRVFLPREMVWPCHVRRPGLGHPCLSQPKNNKGKTKNKTKKNQKKNKLTRQDQINLANKNESQGKLSWRKDVKTRESQR